MDKDNRLHCVYYQCYNLNQSINYINVIIKLIFCNWSTSTDAIMTIMSLKVNVFKGFKK